jgi:hypothetical protein
MFQETLAFHGRSACPGRCIWEALYAAMETSEFVLRTRLFNWTLYKTASSPQAPAYLIGN